MIDVGVEKNVGETEAAGNHGERILEALGGGAGRVQRAGDGQQEADIPPARSIHVTGSSISG
jgi:hypothetical protein